MPRSTHSPRGPRDVALFLISFVIGITLLTLVVIGPTRNARLVGWVVLMVGCLWPIIRTASFRDPYVLVNTFLSFAIIGIIAFHEDEITRAWLAAAIVFISAVQNRLRDWRELSRLTEKIRRETAERLIRDTTDRPPRNVAR